MASLISTMFWIISYLLLFVLKNGDAFGGKDSHYFTVQTSSLFPSSVCTPTQGSKKSSSSLKLVHRHGPCSPKNKATNSPTTSQILAQDRIRVSLIQSQSQSQFAHASNTPNIDRDSKVVLPFSVSQDTYIVKVGLGSPKMDLFLLFDTGSDITWTKCKPCANCLEQKEPIFDSTNSITYSNIPCNSNLCGLVYDATGSHPSCRRGLTCMYNQVYNDKSFSKGFLATETLTLTPSDVITDFVFGCSKDSESNDLTETVGLLGLGRAELSFVSQTAHKYGMYFSYCLPSTSSSVGHLTFGEQGVSSNVQFSPFSTSPPQGSNHYFIDLIAINVGGKNLFVGPTDSSGVGIAIDSGTVITRLPSMTYQMLRDIFKELMTMYPTTASEDDVIDTCYNFIDYSSFTLPKISLVFSGGVEVEMHESGILFGDNLSQMCLAFSGHDEINFPILGSVQQKTLDIVYDVQGGRIGFSAGGCP